MKITRLVRGVRDKNRVNVYLDDKFAFSVSEKKLVEHELAAGKELTKKEIEEIKSDDLSESLFVKSVKYINRRPRSEQEIRLYVQKKIEKQKQEVDGEKIIKEVVDSLKRKEYIDDYTFAKWWVENRLANKNRSKPELKKELIKKYVGRDVIEQVLKENFSTDDENKAIVELASKKMRLLAGKKLTRKQKTEKITRYLLRKGYNWQLINNNIKELLN